MRLMLIAAMAVMVMVAGCKCKEKKSCCGSEKCAAKKAAVVAACKKCGDGPCKCKAPAVKKCTKCTGPCKCKK
jgi:hypothetical protein